MTTPQPSPRTRRQQWSSVVGLVLVYSVCNSTLLVLNKMAVTRVRAPSVILLAQLWSCAFFVYLLKVIKVVQFGDVTAEKLRSFGIIAVGFIAVLYCNMTTLKVRRWTIFFQRLRSFSKGTSLLAHAPFLLLKQGDSQITKTVRSGGHRHLREGGHAARHCRNRVHFLGATTPFSSLVVGSFR